MMIVETVGDKLLNEIERVSAKRERWRGHAMDRPGGTMSLAPGIAMMTEAIETAKRAIVEDDGVASIAALRILEGYDDE